MTRLEEEEELVLPLGEMADRRQQAARRPAPAAAARRPPGARAPTRDTRSRAGHWISTSRLVPQQTGQIVCAERRTLASRLPLTAARDRAFLSFAHTNGRGNGRLIGAIARKSV